MANEVFAVLLQYLLSYFFQNLLWYFFSNFFSLSIFFASNCCVWLSKCLQYFVQYFCCNFYRILCSISFALSLLPTSSSPPSSRWFIYFYLPFLFLPSAAIAVASAAAAAAAPLCTGHASPPGNRLHHPVCVPCSSFLFLLSAVMATLIT